MDNVRKYQKENKGYYAINREERNLAAIFYHTLLCEDNLARFLEWVSCDFPIKPEEVGIYFEYSYLRDLWFYIDDNQEKLELIYQFLRPCNIDELERMATREFNNYFGAVPSPSSKYIQSPGTWSIGRYAEHIYDNEEFLKVCKFKWAFNAKPDIVIHTSHDTAVCIEGKFESIEGSYPAKPSEVMEFEKRHLERVSQTSLQRYIMEELLGIRTQFIFLVQKNAQKSKMHTTYLWKDAFSTLNTDSCPFFIREWIKRLDHWQV